MAHEATGSKNAATVFRGEIGPQHHVTGEIWCFSTYSILPPFHTKPIGIVCCRNDDQIKVPFCPSKDKNSTYIYICNGGRGNNFSVV